MPVDYVPTALGAILGALLALIIARARPAPIIGVAMVTWGIIGCAAGTLFGVLVAATQETFTGSEVVRELVASIPRRVQAHDWLGDLARMRGAVLPVGGVAVVLLGTLFFLLRTRHAPLVRAIVRRTIVSTTAIPALSLAVGAIVFVHINDGQWRNGAGTYLTVGTALATFALAALVFSPVKGLYWRLAGADPDLAAHRAEHTPVRTRSGRGPSYSAPGAPPRPRKDTPGQIEALISSLERPKYRK